MRAAPPPAYGTGPGQSYPGARRGAWIQFPPSRELSCQREPSLAPCQQGITCFQRLILFEAARWEILFTPCFHCRAIVLGEAVWDMGCPNHPPDVQTSQGLAAAHSPSCSAGCRHPGAVEDPFKLLSQEHVQPRCNAAVLPSAGMRTAPLAVRRAGCCCPMALWALETG